MIDALELGGEGITPEAVDVAIKHAVALAIGYVVLRDQAGLETSDGVTATEIDDDGIEVVTRWRFTLRVERASGAPDGTGTVH